MKAFLIHCHSSEIRPIAVLPASTSHNRLVEVLRADVAKWCCPPDEPYTLKFEPELGGDEVVEIEQDTGIYVYVIDASGYDHPNDVYSISEVELVDF